MVRHAIQTKISDAFSRGLRDGRADLETPPNGHVCGHVISLEFEGLSHQDRYQRINKVLGESLTGEELALVGTLLTYTPEEWSFAPEHN